MSRTSPLTGRHEKLQGKLGPSESCATRRAACTEHEQRMVELGKTLVGHHRVFFSPTRHETVLPAEVFVVMIVGTDD